MRAWLLILLVAACAPLPARAQGVAETAMATVCPAAPDEQAPPDFAGPGCVETPLARIDPQGRMIWVRVNLPVPQALRDSPAPIGVFVSAKASSEAWLDGVPIGRNGAPSPTRAQEIPGRMDAVFPVQQGLPRAGAATLVLRMSSHRGLLRLAQPVHSIFVAPYQPPRFSRLDHYWPSLATLGALLAGGLYFAAISLGADRRRGSALLAAMSLLAAAQLFVEAARGLFDYPYPVHDIRLIAIYALSLGFGVLLAAHVAMRFEKRRPWMLTGAIALLTVAISAPAPGFDMKTALAFLVPSLACAAITALRAAQRQRGALAYLSALAAFAAVIVASPILFVDLIFYFAVAALLLFLFVQQAFALSEERRLRRSEAERASQLALVLEQREAAKSATIAVAGAGRVDRVAIADIAFIRGAGDYVELCLLDGRALLHADSLNALEESLPETFIRVHRSHIVNTAHVSALEREPTGVGRLRLANGAEAPVSRRILPKVRAALD